MKTPILIVLVALLTELSIFGQNIRVDDGTSATYRPENAGGSAQLAGRYYQNNLSIIHEIKMVYTDQINGVSAEVNYTIKPELVEMDGSTWGSLDRSADGKNLIVERDMKHRTKVAVSGSITQKGADGSPSVTQLSEIIIPSDGNILSGWLISTNTRLPTMKLSDAKFLPKRPLEFGDTNLKISENAAVSLFWIHEDFRLELISNPTDTLAAAKERQRIRNEKALSDVRNQCLEQLRKLDEAKRQWAKDNNKNIGDTADKQAIAKYLKEGKLPTCPSGGFYVTGSVGRKPSCLTHGELEN